MKRVTIVCDICKNETVSEAVSVPLSDGRRFNDSNLFFGCRDGRRNMHMRPADICDKCFNAVNEVIKNRTKEV